MKFYANTNDFRSIRYCVIIPVCADGTTGNVSISRLVGVRSSQRRWLDRKELVPGTAEQVSIPRTCGNSYIRNYALRFMSRQRDSDVDQYALIDSGFRTIANMLSSHMFYIGSTDKLFVPVECFHPDIDVVMLTALAKKHLDSLDGLEVCMILPYDMEKPDDKKVDEMMEFLSKRSRH